MPSEFQAHTDFTTGPLPTFVSDIYSLVMGTPRSIEDQTLMDFIPGYLLIHLAELEEHWGIANSLLDTNRLYIPFLANYSSDYICWRDGLIVSICHDSPIEYVMHDEERRFYDTISQFYREQVFFLDEDGYLDDASEKYLQIGQQLNPGVPYWFGE